MAAHMPKVNLDRDIDVCFAQRGQLSAGAIDVPDEARGRGVWPSSRRGG